MKGRKNPGRGNKHRSLNRELWRHRMRYEPQTFQNILVHMPLWGEHIQIRQIPEWAKSHTLTASHAAWIIRCIFLVWILNKSSWNSGHRKRPNMNIYFREVLILSDTHTVTSSNAQQQYSTDKWYYFGKVSTQQRFSENRDFFVTFRSHIRALPLFRSRSSSLSLSLPFCTKSSLLCTNIFFAVCLYFYFLFQRCGNNTISTCCSHLYFPSSVLLLPTLHTGIERSWLHILYRYCTAKQT